MILNQCCRATMPIIYAQKMSSLEMDVYWGERIWLCRKGRDRKTVLASWISFFLFP